MVIQHRRSAVIAFACAAAFTSAVAQTQVTTCSTTTPTPAEPIGDRPGHSLQFVTARCTETDGSRDGAVATIHAVWEQDLAVSKLLTADAVVRSRGALMTYHLTEGLQHPVLKDGRPAGWTAIGRGIYTHASGAATALANRTFTWIARSAGAQRWSMEVRIDD